MILCFKLSMPGIGSWDGKWSGSDKFYAKVVNFGSGKKKTERARQILKHQYYTYSWEDGWRAGITVTEVNGKESARIRRKSDGFCGYDWMVDSIIKDGRILTDSEREADDRKNSE